MLEVESRRALPPGHVYGWRPRVDTAGWKIQTAPTYELGQMLQMLLKGHGHDDKICYCPPHDTRDTAMIEAMALASLPPQGSVGKVRVCARQCMPLANADAPEEPRCSCRATRC